MLWPMLCGTTWPMLCGTTWRRLHVKIIVLQLLLLKLRWSKVFVVARFGPKSMLVESFVCWFGFCLVCASQALLTLPRGPQESAQSWYAGSRLGVYIASAITWSASHAPVCHLFISRCKEKAVPYSMAIFEKLVMELIPLAGVRRISWWSDGGRHFRAHAAVATMCTQGISALASRSGLGGCPSFQINFGVASHFKNVCDGCHSRVRSLLNEVARQKKVSNVTDFIREIRCLYDHYKAREEPRKQMKISMQFHDFFPEKPREKFINDFVVCWRSLSFLSPLATCHAYEATLNDKRRLANVKYSNNKGICTGIDFKSLLLADGRACPVDRRCWPAVDVAAKQLLIDACADEAGVCDDGAAVGEAAEDFAWALNEPGNGTIEMHSLIEHGWRTSYRRAQPELKSFETWRAKWSKSRAQFESAGVRLLPPRTRRSKPEQQALQEKWAATRRVKASSAASGSAA